jgi:hypothetical protein
MIVILVSQVLTAPHLSRLCISAVEMSDKAKFLHIKILDILSELH